MCGSARGGGGGGEGEHTVEACGEGGVRGGAEDEDAYVWVGGGVADDVCEFCPHAAGSAGGGKRCDVLIVEGVYRRPAASAGGVRGDAPVELEEQHAGCGGGGCVQFGHRGGSDSDSDSEQQQDKTNKQSRGSLFSPHTMALSDRQKDEL